MQYVASENVPSDDRPPLVSQAIKERPGTRIGHSLARFQCMSPITGAIAILLLTLTGTSIRSQSLANVRIPITQFEQ